MKPAPIASPASGRMVAAGVGDQACRAEQALATSGKLSAPQAKAILADLGRMEDISGMANAIDQQARMEALDLVTVWARDGIERTVWGSFIAHAMVERIKDPNAPAPRWNQPPPKPKIDPAEPDWDIALRAANGLCDRLVAALSKRTAPERKAACDALVRYANGLAGATDEASRLCLIRQEVQQAVAGDRQALDRAVRHIGISAFADNIATAATCGAFIDGANTQRALARAALALAACRAETHRYPKTLAALVPRYLPSVPPDVFTAKPLIYKPTRAGYVLYSVGRNMRDDGGKGRSAGGDDVVVRVGP